MEGGIVCDVSTYLSRVIDTTALQTESSMGMIPRAVDQVFRVAEDLRSKGWEYRMEGQFLEIVR